MVAYSSGSQARIMEPLGGIVLSGLLVSSLVGGWFVDVGGLKERRYSLRIGLVDRVRWEMIKPDVVCSVRECV